VPYTGRKFVCPCIQEGQHMKTRQQTPPGATVFDETVADLLMRGVAPTHKREAFAKHGTLSNGKVQIRRSTLTQVTQHKGLPGRGLFANTTFHAGDIITVYGGEAIPVHVARHWKTTELNRFILRISDSDYVVDGGNFAAGIQQAASPTGRYHPVVIGGPQDNQGAGSMANHATRRLANAKITFLSLSTSNATRVLPRVPALVAKRYICKGEEILFNYGTKHTDRV